MVEQFDMFGKPEEICAEGRVDWLDVPDNVDHHVVSFGAGLQSTALAFLVMEQHPALMRALERTGAAIPEAFVFADTGDEKRSTYRHLWRMARDLGAAGFPLIIVAHTEDGRQVSLSEHVISKAKAQVGGMATPPFYVEDKDGKPVPVLSRSCTHTFKARPLDRWAKDRFKPPQGKALKGPKVAQWRGISTDEVTRMKPHGKRWAFAFYPLIAMGWSREQCERYLEGKQYAQGGGAVARVRSACVFCPYHSADEWREVKAIPEDWKRALALDDELRGAWDGPKSIAGLNTEPFLVQQRVRLREADLDLENECNGICGI